LQPVRQALDFILRQQEPYPAIVIDGRWDVRMRNQGSARLLKPFRDSYEMAAGLPTTPCTSSSIRRGCGSSS